MPGRSSDKTGSHLVSDIPRSLWLPLLMVRTGMPDTAERKTDASDDSRPSFVRRQRLVLTAVLATHSWAQNVINRSPLAQSALREEAAMEKSLSHVLCLTSHEHFWLMLTDLLVTKPSKRITIDAHVGILHLASGVKVSMLGALVIR